MLPFNPKVNGYFPFTIPRLFRAFVYITCFVFVSPKSSQYFIRAFRQLHFHSKQLSFIAVTVFCSITSALAQNPNCPCTVFKFSDTPAVPLANDGQPIEAGMKFLSSEDGYITGFRFYKGEGNTGVHTGHLWSNSGNLLAEAVFTNETVSGWQQVLLSEPLAVTANTIYIVSYHSSSGQYAGTNSYFNSAVVNGPLRALADGEDGLNGVYIYSGTAAFPVSGYQAGNYWADVLFNAKPDNMPPVITNITVVPKINGTATITWTTNENADSRIDYYGPNAAGILLKNNNEGLVTSHSITLNNLSLQTIYYFRVYSADAGNNNSTYPALPATLNFTMPAAPCVQDQFTADFTAGSITPNLYVSVSGGGELLLKQDTAITGFSQLPADWSSYPWTNAGSSVVSGNKLLVEASRYNIEPVTNTFGPGSFMEFSAVFGEVASQHVGFGGGTDATGPGGIYYGYGEPTSFAVFGTGNFDSQMSVVTSDGINSSTVIIPGNYTNASHVYRIEWMITGNFNYYVDGILVHSEKGISLSGPMRPAISDYLNDGIPLAVDWIRLPGVSQAPGIFTSKVFDAGIAKAWNIASWTAVTPPGSLLELYVRTGNTPAPDSSWTDFAVISNGAAINDTSIYIQYKARFIASGTLSPILKDFAVNCNELASHPPATAFVNLMAAKDGSYALLHWTTTAEQSIKGFEIQKSNTDSLNWDPIGFVNSAGAVPSAGHYQYTDNNPAAGKCYYRIRQVDVEGNSVFSSTVSVVFDAPIALSLQQNYPNPFNSSTAIKISIPLTGPVKLILYDQMGRVVRQLIDEVKNPGVYQIIMNRNGLGAGVYYYKLDALYESIVKKMVIL